MPVNTSTGRGQYACFVRRASEDASHEILTNTANTGAAGSTVSTSAGLAYCPASTASQWSIVNTGVDPYVTGDFSVFWYGILASNVSEILLQCHGPYGWTLRVGPWAPGSSALIFEAFWGPAPITKVISTDGATPITIGAAYNDTAATVTLYLNGSSIGSGSYTKDPGAMGGTQAFYMTGDATTPQKCVTVQAFSVLFDGTDFSALHADPFDIFVAPPLDLAASNCTQANASGTGAIGIDGVLFGDSCAQANTSGTGQITRTQTLTGANSTQTNAGGTGSIDPYGRLRAIIAATPTNEWVKVSINSFLDVTIPTADLPPFPGSLGNSASVIYAWSSFAWDHANGNIVMFGGGHANYFGDELYVFDGDKGLWGRLSLPTLVDLDTGIIPSKDAPQSSHTYSNNVWLPNNKMFCTFGGAAAKSGGPMEEVVSYDPLVTRRVGPWCFDISAGDENKVGGANGTGFDAGGLGSQAWHLRIDEVDAVDPAFLYDLSVRSHVGGATIVVDEDGTDVAYTTMDAGGSGFPYWCRYTFGDIRNGGRDTFEKVGTTSGGVMFDGWGVYDPSRGMMYRNSVRMSGNTADILALRVLGATGVTGTTPIQLVDSLGADFPLNEWNADTSSYVRECHYGATYDAENDRIWLWNGDVGNPGRVYYIQIPAWSSGSGWASTTWTIHEVIPTGTTPRGNHQQGVLGKMRAVPEIGAFVALDSTTIDRTDDPAVWLFKTSAQNTLSVSGSNQDNASAPGAIDQPAAFAADNCVQGNASGVGAISQAGVFIGANCSQGNISAAGAITLGTAINLICAPSIQDNIAAASVIVQAHMLAVTSVTQHNLCSTGSSAPSVNGPAGPGPRLRKAYGRRPPQLR